MQENKYKEYLIKKKINNSIIDSYMKYMNDFHKYLIKLGTNGIDKSLHKSTCEYIKQCNFSKEQKETFCTALKYYGLAIENANIVGNANNLLGKSTWMVRLEDTLDEYVGEELCKKIISAGGPIQDNSSQSAKAVWTKCMVDYLEANVDKNIYEEILTNNLHFKSPKSPSFQKLKRMYSKTKNIDVVLAFMHDIWKKRIGNSYGVDSIEYEFVANDQTIESGKREGNIVYVSKIPFNLSKYLRAENNAMKRFHYCHCGWVRESILKSKKEQISPIFCNCSGGWHKLPFEVIFEQTLKVEVVKSVLKGDDNCLFAIHLPKEVMTGED